MIMMKTTGKCPYETPEAELLVIQAEDFILDYDDGNVTLVEEDDWGEG